MKKFMFAAFIFFWSSIVSIWSFATLAVATESPEPGSRVVTSEELAAHAGADDCWMAINGIVYDFTAYIPEHPAPAAVMTQWCGKEASDAYRTKGYGRPHSPAADAMLPEFRIGMLATE